MVARFLLYVIIAVGIVGIPADCQTDQQWLCGTCRILNHEILKAIEAADDTLMTTVGSFRVDPKGNQKLTERKYKRTQAHIQEVLEGICDKMMQYGRVLTHPPGDNVEPAKQTYRFVRVKTEAGEDSEVVHRGPEIQQKLKHKCNDILEDHEDYMEKLFAKETLKDSDADLELCIRQAKYCKPVDLKFGLTPPPNQKKEKKEEEQKTDDKSEL